MRIVYIGCVESSYCFLETLMKRGACVVGVITKKSSSFNADFMDLTPICIKYNIPILYTVNGKDDETIDFAKKCNPDLIFCFGWSYLLNDSLISVPKIGVVGYHPAELPNNRGRHPIIWALALGLTETASTFFMIDKTADTGAIISQEKVPIYETDNARALMDRILDIGRIQVVNLLEQFANSSVIYKTQDITAGNSWRKRTKKDGEIDWRMSSKSIYNLVRALSKPYVGAHFIYNEKEVKVWKIKVVNSDYYANIEPGKIVGNSESGKPLVKTGDGLIELSETELDNLNIGDYI